MAFHNAELRGWTTVLFYDNWAGTHFNYTFSSSNSQATNLWDIIPTQNDYEQIFGDTQLYCKAHKVLYTSNSYKVYVQLWWYNSDTSQYEIIAECNGKQLYTDASVYGVWIAVGLDDDNNLGMLKIITSNTGSMDMYNTPTTLYLYTYISGHGAFSWTSVPSISGKNGTLSFSTIKQESINDGNPVSNAGLDDVNLSDQTKITTLLQNVPRGMEADVIYAGNVDYMSLKRDNPPAITVTAKFYMAGSSAPFYVLSGLSQNNGYMSFLIDTTNEVAKPSIITKTSSNPDKFSYNQETPTESEMQQLYLWLHSHAEGLDPEVNEEDEGTEQDKWLDIPITGLTKPSVSAIDTGFTSMYMMEKADLKSLSDYLWSDNFVDNVTKFFNDPREVIVGLAIMPLEPEHATSKSTIKVGSITTTAQGYALTDQYILDTFGTIKIKTEKGNFLDYPPYTKVTAHLPFVGEHSLDVNDVMGKTLTLKYMFDFLSGSVIAEIDVEGKPRYFFGGACGMQIPTSSEDFGRMYSSILSAGASLGSTLATIATGGMTAPLMIGALANTAMNGMNMTPNVTYSSGDGSINGMLTTQTAYITVEIPRDKIVGEQEKFLGRPSYMKRKLSQCTGYTKCMVAHLDDIPCTATERAEIESQLLSGVRIETGTPTPEYTPTSATDHGIIFVKCESDQDVIGKQWDDEDELTIEGKLMFDQSISNPIFLISGSVLGYNYCYIPDFGRYYYITEQIVKTGNMSEIHMKVDVLNSWQSDILDNDAVIERSQNSTNVNSYFNDSMMWTQQNKIVLTQPFLKSDDTELNFARGNNCFILTVAGS